MAFFFFVFCALLVNAQHLDKVAIKDIVASKHFVFKAQSVMPMGAPSRQLTTDYDLKVAGDSLISYLPYFGRSYVAPPPGEGGINFTSVDFTYRVRERKKSRWEITMNPRDTRDVREVVLTIYENGNAHLVVNSNERQSISYTGYIKK